MFFDFVFRCSFPFCRSTTPLWRGYWTPASWLILRNVNNKWDRGVTSREEVVQKRASNPTDATVRRRGKDTET